MNLLTHLDRNMGVQRCSVLSQGAMRKPRVLRLMQCCATSALSGLASRCTFIPQSSNTIPNGDQILEGTHRRPKCCGTRLPTFSAPPPCVPGPPPWAPAPVTEGTPLQMVLLCNNTWLQDVISHCKAKIIVPLSGYSTLINSKAPQDPQTLSCFRLREF